MLPRTVRRLIAALAAALLLAGPALAQKITVIMPRHEMDLVGLWEAQTRQFEQESGISVEFIQMSWDEVANKVLTDLAAGGGTYDVIEFDNGWVAKFASADWVEPLGSYADQAYLDSLLPGLLATFTKNGQVLGIPWNNDTRFFFYNKAMLDKAGINQPPKTWDDVLTDSKALKDQGIVEYPVTEYWNQEWALANSFAFYLYSFGTDYFAADGTITINKPQAVKALTFMVDMLKNGEDRQPVQHHAVAGGRRRPALRRQRRLLLPGPAGDAELRQRPAALEGGR